VADRYVNAYLPLVNC